MAECGSRSSYVQGCRCDACREANALYNRLLRERPRPYEKLRHGLHSTYVNKRCRCEVCSTVESAYQRARRLARA